jgi:hypothetical protein
MRAGKPKDAIAVLQRAKATDHDERRAIDRLVLRAFALAGDGKEVTARVTALLAADPSPGATAAAVDALAWLGKRGDAIRILGQRPPRPVEGEDAAETAQRRQSQDALALLVKGDFANTPVLRAALTKALGHSFLVHGTAKGKDGKPAPTDLSASPAMMVQLLCSLPSASCKDWANRVLLAMCIDALPQHEPTPLEDTVRAARKDAHVPDSADLPAVLAAIRRGVGDAEDDVALVALRAAQRLAAPPKTR